jgi:prefoldin subunit 5
MNLLQQSLKDVNELKRKHQEQIDTLKQARDKALDELVALSLPEFTREAFARLPALTGYRQFETNDPFAMMERKRQELSAWIVTIEAEDSYVRREQLLDPAAGELTLKRDEMERQHKLLEDAVGRYENEPLFLGLIERSYDTEEYNQDWWDFQYYEDWKYGDEITEKFEQQSFRDVVYNYRQVKAGYEEFGRDLAAVKKQIADVEALIAERTKALSDLETLEADTLKACRQQLREHLEYIDRDDLAAWSAADPNRTGLLKRIHGIEKKMEYLDEMARRYLDPERDQLAAMVDKLGRKIEKYSRPKNVYAMIPVTEANQMLRDPTAKLAARRRRYDEGYQQVVYFENYDAFDYARDMLWWDLMTDGRIDGDYIPEVQAWREQHPGVPRAYDSPFPGASDSPYASPSTSPTGLGSFTDVS